MVLTLRRNPKKETLQHVTWDTCMWQKCENLRSVVKHGSGSVMFCDCFASPGLESFTIQRFHEKSGSLVNVQQRCKTITQSLQVYPDLAD